MNEGEFEAAFERVIRRLTIQRLQVALAEIESVLPEPLEFTDSDITLATYHLKSAIAKLEVIE